MWRWRWGPGALDPLLRPGGCAPGRDQPGLEGRYGILPGGQAGSRGTCHPDCQAHPHPGGPGRRRRRRRGGFAGAEPALWLSLLRLCPGGDGGGGGRDVPLLHPGRHGPVPGPGERLRKLPDLPETLFVVCKPEFSVSTPALYRRLDETAIAQRPDHTAMEAAIVQGTSAPSPGSCATCLSRWSPRTIWSSTTSSP